jgi:hypothetical protein
VLSTQSAIGSFASRDTMWEMFRADGVNTAP